MCKSLFALFDNVKLRLELAKWKADFKLLQGNNEKCQKKVAIISEDYARILNELNASERELIELTNGPEPPATESLRVINTDLLHQLFANRLGQRYADLYSQGKVFWSDLNFLVPQKPDVDRYLRYLKDYWLPIVKPYTVIEWERLDGDVVDIAQCDCDNFAGWYKYKDAEHGLWAALAKTLMWAVVTGPLLKGYHAFDSQPTWEEPYNEQSIEGLELWNMEPQVLGTWPVEVPGIGRARVGQVVNIVPKPTAGAFTITSMGLAIT